MNWTEEEYRALARKQASGASRRLPEADIVLERDADGQPSRMLLGGSGRTISVRKGKRAFDAFVSLCESSGLPVPVKEFKFHPGRRWKFDYAWEAEKVALEVEGGAFTSGRHTRGQGFIDDMEKYNAAVCLGWKLLRFTPEQLAKGECLPALRVLFREA